VGSSEPTWEKQKPGYAGLLSFLGLVRDLMHVAGHGPALPDIRMP